jgi:hypothetical protein
MSDDYIYSASREEWKEDDLQGAIDDVLSNYGADETAPFIIYVYKGKKKAYKASDFVPNHFSDQMSENASEGVGEFADDWLGLEAAGKDLQEALKVFIDDWAAKTNNEPGFFTVDNIEEVHVKITMLTEGDFNYELAKESD